MTVYAYNSVADAVLVCCTKNSNDRWLGIGVHCMSNVRTQALWRLQIELLFLFWLLLFGSLFDAGALMPAKCYHC